MPLWALQRTVPAPTGPGGVGMGPLPGGWLICVIETRSSSFREHLRLRASVPLGLPIRARGSGEAFYISEAAACHCFSSFTCPLYFPSPVFPCLLQPFRKRNKEGWENPILLCFSLFTVLVCLLFLHLFPFFSTISVLLLHMRLESLFPSSFLFFFLNAFNCFGAFCFSMT